MESSKRLLFDRRYGWVVDDWKDPSQEALAGGRGMFCILPLAKTLLQAASRSINFTASSALKVYERPDLLSPQCLHAGITDQLRRLTCFAQKPDINFFNLNGSQAQCSDIETENTKQSEMG